MTKQTTLAVRAQDEEFRMESRLGPLAHVGIIPKTLSNARDAEVTIGMSEALAAFSIEPLFFKDIGFTDHDRVHTAVHMGDANGRYYRMRLGATNVHDDAWRNWTRRPLAEYVFDGNPIPTAAVRVLERLQAARLPIGCSMTVWVPDHNTHKQQELPDPMLVLELSNGSCFALCRWNG